MTWASCPEGPKRAWLRKLPKLVSSHTLPAAHETRAPRSTTQSPRKQIDDGFPSNLPKPQHMGLKAFRMKRGWNQILHEQDSGGAIARPTPQLWDSASRPLAAHNLGALKMRAALSNPRTSTPILPQPRPPSASSQHRRTPLSRRIAARKGRTTGLQRQHEACVVTNTHTHQSLTNSPIHLHQSVSAHMAALHRTYERCGLRSPLPVRLKRG